MAARTVPPFPSLEPEWHTNFIAPFRNWCHENHPKGNGYCTREPGHAGPHVAGRYKTGIVGVYNDTTGMWSGEPYYDPEKHVWED